MSENQRQPQAQNPTNGLHRLEPRAPGPFEGDDREIIHRFLTIRPNTSEKPLGLQFDAHVVATSTRGSDVDSYARSVTPSFEPPPSFDSPYDIHFEHPRWIVLQLDSKTNWVFAGPGITTKEDEAGQIFGPYFVIDTPTGMETKGPGGEAPDGCQVLYFAVTRQRNHATPAKANFHIAFSQKGNAGIRLVLPTIFDPDVGNNGGSIP